jgi:hypothetical protein
MAPGERVSSYYNAIKNWALCWSTGLSYSKPTNQVMVFLLPHVKNAAIRGYRFLRGVVRL